MTELKISRHLPKKCPICVIHGAPGSGKTTLASKFPKPVFLRTEDGLGNIEVDTFPVLNTFDMLMQAVKIVYESQDYQTIVIDSLSALEPLIFSAVAKDNGKSNIEDIGYKKGYVFALDYWDKLFKGLNALSAKGVMPILIAHSSIKNFQNPEGEPYDRYVLKLHSNAADKVTELADIIGFVHRPVVVKDGKGLSSGNNRLILRERPAMIAKNRYQMPDEINLDFESFQKALKGNKNE